MVKIKIAGMGEYGRLMVVKLQTSSIYWSTSASTIWILIQPWMVL